MNDNGSPFVRERMVELNHVMFFVAWPKNRVSIAKWASPRLITRKMIVALPTVLSTRGKISASLGAI